MVEITVAPFGMIALETTLSQVITYLVRPGLLSLSEALAKLSTNPSKLLGLESGTLNSAKPADLVIFDPNRSWTVDTSKLKSKSNNTPLNGTDLFGVVTHTFVDGQLRYSAT
jgi:dihydroorotase